MKERPIIITGNRPRLILDGIKTMTRRVIKPQPLNTQITVKYIDHSDYWQFGRGEYDQSAHCVRCPYGQVGDRLWVRETWATENRYNHLKPSEVPRTAKIWYLADEQYDPFVMGIIRPSIFMCYWMSRARLEITELRAERLQEISLEDIQAEGCEPPDWHISGLARKYYDNFTRIWDSLNAKHGYGWDLNKWVWVISSKVIK